MSPTRRRHPSRWARSSPTGSGSPTPGLYWYHPHVREDYGLDMGLYGNLVVVPADEDYWPPVNREVVVTLDDVLVEDGRITPYNVDGPSFVAMGRFGNVMLTAGDRFLDIDAHAGEVVRFYFTSTANTRLFNVGVPGAQLKLVGGDSGRYEHETFVDEVLDVTNPGLWMAHCHIAEHHQSGMMFSFPVTERSAR